MQLTDNAKTIRPKLQMVLLAVAAIILVAVAARGISYAMSKQVSIVDENGEFIINTLAKTTGDVFEQCNISLAEGDEVSIPLDGKIKDQDQIVIARAKQVTLYDGDNMIQRLTTKPTVAEFLDEAGVEVGGGTLDVAPDAPITKNMTVAIVRYREEIITEEEDVPYKTTNRPSDKLKEGEKKVAVEGQNGVLQKSYKVSYENGVETGRELVSTIQSKDPVNQIVEYGKSTRVANVRGTVTSRSGDYRYHKIIQAKATAYTAASSSNTTATGARVRRGVVAVDPSVIPLGSKLYIESADGNYVYGEAVAADTGGAIKGARVDVYLDTLAECRQFGVRTVKVYVLE